MMTLELGNGEWKNFLVDTGSCFSIVQHYDGQIDTTDKPCMTAVNGSRIEVQGTVVDTVVINEIPYEHRFVVANVSHNILGYDFWSYHELTIRPVAEGVEVYPNEIKAAVKPLPSARARMGMVNGIFNENREEKAKEFNRRMVAMETITRRMEVNGEIMETPNLWTDEGNVNTTAIPTAMPYEISNGVPYYKPKQVHSDKSSLVNAVMEKDNKDYLIYAEHLDMYQGLADEDKEKQIDKLIADRSAEDLKVLSDKFVKCFAEQADFNKPSKIPIVHHIEFDPTIEYKQPFVYKVNLAYHDKVKKQLDDLEKERNNRNWFV